MKFCEKLNWRISEFNVTVVNNADLKTEPKILFSVFVCFLYDLEKFLMIVTKETKLIKYIQIKKFYAL